MKSNFRYVKGYSKYNNRHHIQKDFAQNFHTFLIIFFLPQIFSYIIRKAAITESNNTPQHESQLVHNTSQH